MEQNKLYGSRIPRAPKRALKSLSENEVHAKTGGNGAGGNHENQILKKPRLEESKAGGADGGLDTEWLEMSEKNGLNIDSLLGMRMTGKGKWDHKGRCEQMMPYIKQLRACTRYLRSCVAKADGIKQNLIDAHEKNLSERETELEKLNEQLAELDKQCESSKDTISTMKGKVNEMKKELEDKHEVEMQQKVEISTLSNELSHEKKVVSEKNEEITKIQDNYIKSQEYAQNLQDFVKKLKEDTQKMNDSLLKIQEEKADLVNDLNLSRGNAAQLEEKLQGSKDLVEQLQKQKKELDETLEAMKEQHSKSIEEMATSFKEKEAEAKENFEKLKSEKNQKEEELKSIEVKHKDVCEALEGCEKELNLKITSLQELDSKCSGLENTIQENKVRYESELKVRIDEAQAEKESFEEAKASLESSLEEKNAELSQIGSLLADSEIKLQELSNNFEKTKIELQACQDELSGKENECQTLNSELEKAHVELDDYQKTKTVLQACQDELSSKVSECQAMSSELEKAQGELGKYQQITGQSAENMEKLMQKSQQLQDQNSSQNEVLEAIKAQYEIVKQKLSLCEVQNNALQEEHQSTMSELQMKETLLKEADQQIHEGEMLRRKLHNQILELKGNIRVFCRTRPLSEEETNLEGCQNVPTISYTSKGEKIGKGLQLHLTTNKQSKKRSSNGESHYNFDFDRAFQENASQEEIFEEISQLVQSALDGYKVCIFAYGQTGSGKTHTMIGNPSCPGMIPRSLEQIFTSAEKMKDQGWKYSISVSMLEIYNEEYKDLLGKKLPAGKQHTVKHDQQGKTSVSYMTDVKVTSMEKVNTLLNKAMSVRSVAATQCNEHSSRSHFVFRLNIEGSNDTLGQTVNGVLNLVDLAGSERLSKSQATGDRLKETQNINKSLSALGDVILSINNGDSHIPYRNSKLTWLLQPCLGNQSKALMFVNIAPSQEAAQETLCSLRFASKVNACEIGTAKRYVS